MPNKITNRLNIKLLTTIIFSTTSLPVLYAQKNSEPQVIREYSLYKRSLKDDSLKKMVSSRWKRNGGIFFWNNPDFELLAIDPKKFKKL